LCVLDEIDTIKTERQRIWQTYEQELAGLVEFQQWNPQSQNNHAYAPVLFESEAQLLKVEAKLKENNILARRYFYPSLDTLDYLKTNQTCLISRDIANRILCLPIYPGLAQAQQNTICGTIREQL
ncbi:MAG: DegT/DnrJ/EryC1/StrS family aminotransferase, partial [Gammaproteobacteria bacterium]|nr:DegT/DnrJ/EryC1/StrS family aminotransferase [Gammaproteobacteria bacterium]